MEKSDIKKAVPKMTTLTLEEDIKEKLWAIADANHCSLSDVIRHAIDKLLKELEGRK